VSDDSSFDDLMARLRAGDEAAAAQLFERFAHRLIALARSRLDRRLRQKMDAEDVVQSVLNSFFARFTHGQFDLHNWEGLWGLLVVITLRKCGRKAQFYSQARRDVSREVAGGADDEEVEASWAGIARDPTPDEAAVLADTVEQIVQGLKERERRIFELRLEGHSTVEISAQVGRSEHTVNWVLRRIRKRLQQLRDQAGGQG
jgi:RNA polymerase sigma-70 factor (ECF subfamily)